MIRVNRRSCPMRLSRRPLLQPKLLREDSAESGPVNHVEGIPFVREEFQSLRPGLSDELLRVRQSKVRLVEQGYRQIGNAPQLLELCLLEHECVSVCIHRLNSYLYHMVGLSQDHSSPAEKSTWKSTGLVKSQGEQRINPREFSTRGGGNENWLGRNEQGLRRDVPVDTYRLGSFENGGV